MATRLTIDNMRSVLAERQIPSITIWNRLEGRPRTLDFGRALRAEVRDGLWMLTRQWQVGEFLGDDAGSPVLARFQMSNAPLDGFRPGDGADVGYDGALPLETIVERRPSSVLETGGHGAIDLRLALGRRFLRLIPATYRTAFIARHAFVAPDPTAAADAELVAHTEVWATLRTLAGRAMDGLSLYDHLTAAPTNRVWDGVIVLDADKPALADAAARLVLWFDQLFERPVDESAWDEQRLEHRFSVTAGVDDGAKRLLAEEYPGGRLDWTAFSIDPAGARGSGAFDDALTVVPTAARFTGMPNPRWWAFEDGRTNLGDVRADTTDLARLLFIEFALVYGNDWCTIPIEVTNGTLACVEGLAVTNVFGERLWIDAAGRGDDDDWTRWSMYTLDIAGLGHEAADTSLLLAPSVADVLESKPLEDVAVIRDEMANMVWGIETVVPLATGRGTRGAEAATETLRYRTRLVRDAVGPLAPAAPPAAPIAYTAMTTVPEHWIPFVAVHVPGDVRETQLQRGAMPRVIEGGPAPVAKVRPRTSLLRPGLDELPLQPFFVHEQEITRAGTHVSLGYQRTRWLDGRVVLWVGAKRTIGRGEGSSGLAFDILVNPPAG